MKHGIAILGAAAFAACVSGKTYSATLIETDDLVQYFVDNNISFQTKPDFYGSGDDYKFFSYPDPSDSETMAIFLELRPNQSFSDTDAHFGIGLRGPHSGSPANVYGGRGVAFGHLGSFNNCSATGFFLEDFSLNESVGQPDMQLTFCEPKTLRNNQIYRFDIHASKGNVYVAIWRKWNWFGTWYYSLIAEESCTYTPGPSRPAGLCPEQVIDSPYGGAVVGGAFLDPSYSWSVENIHIAHW